MKKLWAFLAVCMMLLDIPQCYSQELPIKPTRTISFTTDEGSYMDVNVSPDEKMIVFTLLGDLYLVATSGGNAVQLTRGMALNLRPVWSPDGKKIAYISDYSGALHFNVRDISGKFHLVLGKSDRQVYPNSDRPVWVPESNSVYIGFIDTDHPNIAYGLNGRTTKFPENFYFFSINDQLAYYTQSGLLYRYYLKSNKIEKVDSLIVHAPDNITLSPDAHWLAYTVDSNETGKRSLIVQDLINHSRKILVQSLITTIPYLPDAQRQSTFSFSQNSKNIYVSYEGKIHRIDVQTGKDHVIPFVANVKADLGTLVYNTYRVTHDSMQIKYIRSANKSSDGKHLVFMSLNKLYVMDLPNGKPRQLVLQPSISQFQPVYSPDGKWIAYVSWCDTSGGQLWRVSSFGGLPEQLTNVAGQYQRPSWSADGKTIALIHGDVKFSDGKWGERECGKLEIINIENHSVTIIDNDVPLWNQLSFSKDGNRMIYQPKDFNYSKFFGENDSLKPRLISKDLSGDNQQILATGSSSTKEPHFFQQRSISPDGRYVVYAMREDIYLVPVGSSIDAPVIFDSEQKNSMIRFAAGVDPHWEQGGKLLAWTYANKFYRINPDRIINAAKKKNTLGFSDTGLVKVKIEPDEIISIDLKVPTKYGKGTIALKNVRIITMQGSKVIEDGTIVIKNGRFSQVGATSQVRIPKDAKMFDLSGTTIMPGMIDMHMHMNCRENVYPMQRGDCIANLAYGVTTGRDPASSFDSFGTGELLASGNSIGPRLFTVGRAIFQYSKFKLDDFNDALAIGQKRKLFGGTYIKQYNLTTRIQKQWLLMASKRYGLNITNEGNDGIESNNVLAEVAMIKDGSTGVEHNPDWGDVYNDVITFFAKSESYLGETLGIGYGPEGDAYFNYTYWRKSENIKLRRFATSRFGDGDNEKIFKKITTSVTSNKQTLDSLVRYPAMIDAKITALGGKVTLGAHGSSPIGVTAHNVLWAMKMGGITNMQALQQATIRGAEALGMQKDLGSIEVGKIADLIILNANPLDDIHNSREIRYVMKDGILYNGDTLDEEWPEKKKCPEWRMKETNEK